MGAVFDFGEGIEIEFSSGEPFRTFTGRSSSQVDAEENPEQ
jgi:hypothetical protein